MSDFLTLDGVSKVFRPNLTIGEKIAAKLLDLRLGRRIEGVSRQGQQHQRHNQKSTTGHRDGPVIPTFAAARTSSATDRTFIFSMTLARWISTVR